MCRVYTPAMRLALFIVLLSAAPGCRSRVAASRPAPPPDNQSSAVRVTSVAEARAVAQQYLRDHNLEDGTTLSEGIKSHSEGWSFLVDFNESLVVGGHFFLRVLPDGTVIQTGGA